MYILLETSSCRCKKLAIVIIVLLTLTAAVAAALVIISYIHPTAHVPDAISSITVYPTQSNVVLLGSFNKSEYASFDIRSNFSNQSKALGNVWIFSYINPQQYHYNKFETINQKNHSDYYYVLADSAFHITLSHLTGPTDAIVVVEFKDYNGSDEGTVLSFKKMGLPIKRNTMTASYHAKKDRYIQYQVLVSEGVNGTIDYEFYINELDINSTRKQHHFFCCALSYQAHSCSEHKSPFDTNFVVLSMENLKNIDIFPSINVTIFGEDKHILPNDDIIGGGSIAVLVMCIVACFFIILCLVGRKNACKPTAS